MGYVQSTNLITAEGTTEEVPPLSNTPVVDPTTPPQAGEEGQQIDYIIRAPKGGLEASIKTFMGPDDENRPVHIEVTVRRGLGKPPYTLRIIPDRGAVVWEPEGSPLFRFHSADCVRVEDGEEVDAPRRCTGHINTEVRTNTALAGNVGVVFNPEETPWP